MIKFNIVIVILMTFSCLYSEEIILPREKQVIKVKYGSPSLTISNESEFITIWLEKSGIEGQCKYKVIYGSIKSDIAKNSTRESLVKESNGIFDEKLGFNSSTLIWPGTDARSGIIRDLYVSWSSGSAEFGYLYVPENMKMAIGFDFP